MPSQSIVDLYAWAWPAARLGEGLELLARKAKLISGTTPALEFLSPPLNLTGADEATWGQWVELNAGRLGIEAEPMQSSFAEVDRMVRAAAPAILRLPPLDPPAPADSGDGAGPQDALFLLVLSGGGRLTLLRPDLGVQHVRPELVRDALCRPLVAPWLDMVDRWLSKAGLPEARRQRARLALIQEQLGPAPISGGWLLRLSPAAGLWQQVAHFRLWRPFLTMLGANLVQQAVLVLAWWVIGRSALEGRFEWAWLLAWALLLFTLVPFQALMAWSANLFSTGMGSLFKQRLLYGALKLEPDEIRHQGMGQFLGRVMESEAVELLALGGGLLALVAIVQLGTAAWVLAMGAGGWLHVALLVAWASATLVLGWLDYRHSHEWARAYRVMTNDLVEGMVGHRTRLAQEDARAWHAEEDRMLGHYLDLSLQFDRSKIGLAALPSSWLVAGLGGLAYTFVSAPNASSGLAVSLGGVLLAFQALTSIVAGVQSLVQLGMAWEQVAPLFHAATRPLDVQRVPLLDGGQATLAEDEPVVLAKDLHFRYRPHGRLVLQGCTLKLYRGDRVLLEGPSGGGKTTLAAVLAGLRWPESGLLLLRGYDRQSLGSQAWQRRVVVAPQFHENHIFTETFGFNLLLGRRWPPTLEDIQAAEEICHELGLGELIERMPSGWQQIVGESGWQLSHGERSRVFIARALLQNADVIIMDESFGALDPENLQRALQCALNRAPTLLVIAHP